MKIPIAAIVTAWSLVDHAPPPRPSVLIVAGAPGDPDYELQFRRWADRWDGAAATAGVDATRIGIDDDDDPDDRAAIREWLARASATAGGPLWIVLIGHGTFDGSEAKFNLRGPDLTALELDDWLEPIGRPVAVIDCSSSSGPFINALSGEGRVIITATRSGDEQNYARFGRYLAEAIAEPAADLDKDDQVSLLEAFLVAGGRVEEFYRSESRLATEHALLDDNGDGLGTPADWFRGVRAVRRAADGASPDGIGAHQFHLVPSDRERSMSADATRRRDEIERSLAALRDQKADLEESEYYRRLEPLMIELARLYREVESPDGSRPDPSK